MLINPVNLSYMGGPGLIPSPIPGVSRVEVLPTLGFVLSGDLSVGQHHTKTLGSCSRSLYAARILKAHGLPTSSLHEVIRAPVLARLLYAAPAWRGFATAHDCSRIDRFINKAVNLGYLPADCLPPILTRRPGLRKRVHPFTLPLKDDKQCIPCVLYRALLPPVQS